MSSLIVPADVQDDANMDVYAASCNPPRRAKRLRTDSTTTSPPHIQPDSSSSSAPSPDDDDPHDDPLPPPPKRRGRKPGTLSRAAREAQRKINHSLIEKARRTKINEALATLRQLVPLHYKRANDAPDDSDDDDDDPKPLKQKPKGTGEKEFKLEILVRTVAYLQDLTEKVKQLEEHRCPCGTEPTSCQNDPRSSQHCHPSKTLPDGAAAEVNSSQHNHSNPSSPAPPPSRLPSISTWLPSSVEEQATLLLTPSQSPAFGPVTGSAPVRVVVSQLPTPPTSATFAPSTTGFAIPPTLTLPSPTTSPVTQLQPRFSGFTARPNSKKSPLSSPVYTPDDETAASLLLRMSTSTSPHSSLSKPYSARLFDVEKRGDVKDRGASGCALTPSRLLGLTNSEDR